MTPPSLHLAALARDYPGLWRTVDEMRAQRGRGLPEWPAWCFLPMAGAYAIASGGRDRADLGDVSRAAWLGDVARIAALAAWRPGQGLYRYDPDLYDAVTGTALRGPIPVDVLHRLPEWCPYVETPESTFYGAASPGFWAHLEWDANTGREDLRLLVDAWPRLYPLILHMVPGAPVEQAVEAALGEAVAQAGRPLHLPDLAQLRAELAPRLALVLYLCTEDRDLAGPGGQTAPTRPEPVRPRRETIPRLYPPPGPVSWGVGLRIGAELRAARDRAEAGEGGEAGEGRARPRPHLRVAHWATYWTGPRSAPVAALRWVRQTLVAARGPEDLVPTVRPVRR